MVVSSLEGSYDGAAKRRESTAVADDVALMQLSQTATQAIEDSDPNLYRGSGRRPSIISRSDSGPTNPINELHNSKLVDAFALISMAKKWRR